MLILNGFGKRLGCSRAPLRDLATKPRHVPSKEVGFVWESTQHPLLLFCLCCCTSPFFSLRTCKIQRAHCTPSSTRTASDKATSQTLRHKYFKIASRASRKKTRVEAQKRCHPFLPLGLVAYVCPKRSSNQRMRLPRLGSAAWSCGCSPWGSRLHCAWPEAIGRAFTCPARLGFS